MSQLVPVAEPKTAEEVMANLRAVRARMNALTPAKHGIAEQAERQQPTRAFPALPEGRLPDGFARMLSIAKQRREDDFKTYVWLADVLVMVSTITGYTVVDLRSTRRTYRVVTARQLACWLARHFTTFSYPDIARNLGGRDHTTIMHAVRVIDQKVGHHRERILALGLWGAAEAAWPIIEAH